MNINVNLIFFVLIILNYFQVGKLGKQLKISNYMRVGNPIAL